MKEQDYMWSHGLLVKSLSIKMADMVDVVVTMDIVTALPIEC